MEQVAAGQRIKVATKDHVLISTVHLKLHPKVVPLVVFMLLLLSFVVVIVFGLTTTNIVEEIVQGIMTAVIAVAMMATGIALGRANKWNKLQQNRG